MDDMDNQTAPHERRLSSDLNTDEEYKDSYKRRSKNIQDVKYAEKLTKGLSPKTFYSLPRKKHRKLVKDFDAFSLDRKSNKQRESSPPAKPPRIFVSSSESLPKVPLRQRRQKENSNEKIRRSLSDATSLKSQAYGPVIDKSLQPRNKKLSVGEYTDSNQKKIIRNKVKKEERIVDKLKQYIDEVDQELYNETGIRYKPPASKKNPTPVVIDLDKAEKISDGKTKFKYSFGKTFKSLGQKINRLPQTARNVKNSLKISSASNRFKPNGIILTSPTSKLQSGLSISSPAIHLISKDEDDKMDSKKYVSYDSTKGSNVNRIINQLSADNVSHIPPMPRSALVTPNSSVQHNQSQPFSYTKGLTPIILDFQRRNLHSDTDEGLEGEDNLVYKKKCKENFNQFQESPILPRYRQPTPTQMFDNESFTKKLGQSNNKHININDSKERGLVNRNLPDLATVRSDITARRDLLEIRNKRRVCNTLGSQGWMENPKNENSFTPHPNEVFVKKTENQYQSTPEINNNKKNEYASFFNSLQKNRHLSNNQEKQIKSNNSMSNLKVSNDAILSNESEDEGFASSYLIYNRSNKNPQNRVLTQEDMSSLSKHNIKENPQMTPLKESNKLYSTSTEEETVIDSCSDINIKKNKRYFGDTDSEKNKFRPNNDPGTKTSNCFKIKTQNEGVYRNKTRSNGENKNVTENKLLPGLTKSLSQSGSQQSLGSVVYLHAATVCDIPKNEHNRSNLNINKTSGKELGSIELSQPYIKSSSRSFSVLAPWKPNRYKGTIDIDYSQPPDTTIKKSDGSMMSSKNKRLITSFENKSKKGKGVEISFTGEKVKTKRSKGSRNIFRSLSIPREKEQSWWFRK